jgi:S1-C subfamily serine protease
VAFCINCGAHNPEDAVFCLSCGQTLYRAPQKLAPIKTSDWRRIRIPLLICLVVLLGVFAVVVSLEKFGNSPQNSSKGDQPLIDHSQRTTQLDEAVLMIVGTNAKGSPVSQGSGFILASDGLAGSNYHVLRGVTDAFAECCNGRKFKILSIEGADLEKDLVVFQLYEVGRIEKPQNLPYVAFAPSKDLKVGQKVIAVGSPQGLENTVSDGILSAIREYDSVRYLQITAPISPGSSGGPVLDTDGHMIGVATFQFERGQNLNFAIAADYIPPLLNQHFQVSIKEFQTIVRHAQQQERGGSTSSTGDAPKQDPRSDKSPLTGEFGGIVHNHSADIAAEFGIVVLDKDGILTGCMGVQQPLFGSGPLEGFISDSDITFIVTSAIGKITFQGKRKNGAINGTYTVEHPDGTEQQGSFTLQRTSSKGPGEGFNTSNCPTDAELHH